MTTINTVPLINEKDNQYVQHFIEVQEDFSLLNIFSSKGFGKSTFLNILIDTYRDKHPFSLIHVLDYCSDEPEGIYRLDKCLAQIVNHLQAYLSDKDKLKLKASEDIGTVAHLSAKIIELVNLFSENDRTTLILIDDYDRLPDRSRAIFEDMVLGKVIDRPLSAKVILTSGNPLLFKDRLDLRVRLKTRGLNALDQNDIVRTINQRTASAPLILKWSGGIPGLVNFLVDKVNEPHVERFDVNHIPEKELIDQNYRSHISKVLFPKVEILSEEVVDVLALLRRFDVAILSEILPKIEPDRFLSFKQKDYFDLIRELGDTVYWRVQGGYALNSILRGMLSSYIRVFEPKLYKEVNNITAITYGDWLKDEFRPHYLTEMLFHQTQLEKIKKTEDNKIAAIVSNRILGFIESRGKSSAHELDGLDEIKQTLDKDPDLRPYIKQEVFEAIEHFL